MPRKSKGPPVEDIFEIKAILKYEARNQTDYYLVEWDGYSLDQATWEPRSNFFNPTKEVLERLQELKNEYLKAQADNAAEDDVSAIDELEEKPLSSKTKSSKQAQSNGSQKRKAGAKSVSTMSQAESNTEMSDGPITKRKRPVPLIEKPSEGIAKISTKKKRSLSPAAPSQPTSQSQFETKSPRKSDAAKSNNEAPAVAVKSIRQDPQSGLYVILTFTYSDGTTQDNRKCVEDVRRIYPDQLIEFLLQRIQFRVSTKQPPEAATATTTTAKSGPSATAPASSTLVQPPTELSSYKEGGV